MATNATWTIVFDDKTVIKNYAEGASEGIGYIISDDALWSDAKFSNIWAIQYGATVSTDEVEYRDSTPHSSYADANLGDISQFSSKWDSLYLLQLQSDWDGNTLKNSDGSPAEETEAQKIARLGPRPTSYSS